MFYLYSLLILMYVFGFLKKELKKEKKVKSLTGTDRCTVRLRLICVPARDRVRLAMQNSYIFGIYC